MKRCAHVDAVEKVIYPGEGHSKVIRSVTKYTTTVTYKCPCQLGKFHFSLDFGRSTWNHQLEKVDLLFQKSIGLLLNDIVLWKL